SFAVIQKSLTLLKTIIPTTTTITEDLEKATGTILADPAQTETVIMNLVTNAAVALDGEIGEIAVSLSPVEVPEKGNGEDHGLAAGRYAKVIVADNGPGMEDEVIERIFDPFFTTKDVGAGTGLGLSMAHGIIERHDGHISVSGKIGPVIQGLRY
ncbi:MAG: ATP-binding protein, partial [Rhodospirillales bacterium]|nr:ATP-binding protein [Rhodospirillales bacterium]